VRVRLLVTVACLVAVASPAWAADTLGDVEGTVSVTGGAIFIAAPASADFGAGTPGVDVTAALGTVTVTDLRGLPSASWVATVTSTGLTTGGAGPFETIPPGAIDYWSGPATATEGVGTFGPGQLTPADAVPLATEPVAFSEDGGDGGGSASWNPTLTVHLPPGVVAGTYVGTVTHSVV
jgi:hypothetical protein